MSEESPSDAMYWTCAEVLALGAQLAGSRDLPAADVMQRRISALLDEMERRGATARIAQRDLEDVKYAIVAFLDEQLFRAQWAGRQHWMLEPLQLIYFNENTAGEGFFARLEALEREAGRAHVLEIYYLCLALGFQGKYAVRSGEGLGAILDKLSARLARSLAFGDTISPHGLPVETGRRRTGREAPVVTAGIALVVAALVAFVAMKLVLGSVTADVAAIVQRALPPGPTPSANGAVRP